MVFLALLLSGCSTAYQPQSFTGGFSETQIDENVFKVSFTGNGYTSREKASDFALLRSAELSLKNGYKFFVIVDGSNYSTNSTYTTPTTYHTNATFSSYGNTGYGHATTRSSGGQTYNIAKPNSTNTIACFKEKPEGTFSYNADFIYKSLSEKYRIKKPE